MYSIHSRISLLDHFIKAWLASMQMHTCKPFCVLGSSNYLCKLGINESGESIHHFSLVCRPVGIYVAVLLLVMKRDLLRFLLLFSVLIISFGGGFYLALRGEIISNGSINSSSNASINSGSNASDFDPINDTSLGLFPHETR